MGAVPLFFNFEKLFKRLTLGRKIYIALTLLVYLVGVVYIGIHWHFHLNLGEKQFAEHKCIGHKFHPDLKSELACVISRLNLNHVFVKGYNLSSFAISSSSFALGDLILPKSQFFSLVSNRAPPVS